MKDFRDLTVWQKAHTLTLDVYGSTTAFPKDEMYSLTNQIRRAAVSIPANIDEGCGKRGDKQLAHYLTIAMGSASELEYELLLAHDLHYLADEAYQPIQTQLVELRRMLNGLIQKCSG